MKKTECGMPPQLFADESLRPQSLAEFIGHSDLRANLQVYLQAAGNAGKPWITPFFTATPVLARRRSPRLWPKSLV